MMATTSGPTENGQQHQRQVLHVREDSDSAMDDLFSVINNPNPNKGASSFRTKNLPKSFFKPPEPSRSSRENLLQQDGGMGQQFHPGLVPQHSRSRSSPAQLPNSLSMQPQVQVNHRPQHSVDFTEELPAQWTDRNHRYMINSPNNQQQQNGSNTASPATSQWSVNAAQKSLSSGNLVEQNNNNNPVSVAAAAALSPASSSHGPSPATSLQNLNLGSPSSAAAASSMFQLPAGWDVSLTADQEIYFINHISKTTSWYHPSQRQHQGPGPMKLSQLPLTQQQFILQQQQALQQAQQQQQLLQQQQLSPPPPQQLPAAPRRATTQSPPSSSAAACTTSPQPPPPPTSSSSSSASSEQQIYLELQRLQKEKERLHREQEDIMRKERLLQTNFSRPNQTSPPTSSAVSTASPSNAGGAGNQLSIIGEESAGFQQHGPTMQQHRNFQEQMLKKDLLLSPAGPDSLMHPQNTPVDPFLGQQTIEAHARQNSADSGLGGMGTNYSLPRTPEDFLSNVDEMDSSNDAVVGGQKLVKQGGSGLAGLLGGEFNMDMGCAGQTSMDITLGDVGDNSNTMGDDLVSTLQEDMVTSEFLNDVDLQKDLLNPTWL